MPDKTGSDDLYLSDVSSRDKPWDTHRVNAKLVQKLYNGSDLQQYADRIKDCSRLLGFAFEAQDSGQLKLRLQLARFCRVRHCPVCQWRRSLMWRARFLQALPRVIEAYPTGRWVFLTLTVKNCPLDELRDTLRKMNKAWERLTKRKQFPGLGFVKSTEVTRSANGDAHPHFHCLLLVSPSYFGKPYLTQADWTELWKQALRADYTPVVNVKAVKPKAGSEPGSGVITAVLETLKYGVKEQDLLSDAAWLQELTKQLHKTRAVSVGGVLRKYISDEEPEDLIHGEDEEGDLSEEVDIWFGWREMANRYVKTEH
jgi:plasmid rolling circle replication initiator protein Rep